MGGKLNVYQGLVEEFRRLIEMGALKNGERLPSCRALATERGINPNTVEKAYSELEASGYIRILLKKGAYVDHGGGKRAEEIRRQIRLFRAAGATKEEVEFLLEEVYAEAEPGEETAAGAGAPKEER